MDNKIDYVFVAVGTGGTISGISKFLKEKIDSVKIIAIDIFDPNMKQEERNKITYKVEGVGSYAKSELLDKNLVDDW